MRVDHGRDRVRGVVEAVHELEAERDDERDAEQDIGQKVRDPRLRRVDIDIDAVGDEKQPGREDREEAANRQRR